MRKFIFLYVLGIGLAVSAQTRYSTGLLPDDGTYDQLPCKAELLTRDYTVLPTSHSLVKYCPEVRSQSNFGTCTAWAASYAARTIAEAVKYGWTDKQKITDEAFSPAFTYAQIKSTGDNNCQRGSQIYKAMELMKTKGAAKIRDFDVLCATKVNDNLIKNAPKYKIDDYFTLFSLSFTDVKAKVRKVKKALSEDCPVVIAMHLPSSFDDAGSYWDGLDLNPRDHGYHAMCVVGYDDNQHGGAFLIMNSWGKRWGSNGFVWVSYQHFGKYVDQAYELYVKKELPNPTPAPVRMNELSGKVELQLATGEMMVPVLEQWNGTWRYRIAGQYPSRTRYRIYISNSTPAYVYVIGSDLKNNVSKVFPENNHTSAAMTYKQNHIAIPDERYYVEMDDTQGIDFMCVLYAAKPLDINAITEKIRTSKGTFYEKVKLALGNMKASEQDVRFIRNRIGFTARTTRTVVPLITEITHQ